MLHHRETAEVRARLERELLVEKSFAIEAAAVAPEELFGANASDALWTALAKSLTRTNAALLPALARLEPKSARTTQLVRAGLESGDRAVVVSAAKAAAECEGPGLIDVMHETLTAWAARAVEKAPSEDRSDATAVAEALLDALAQKKALNYELLKELTEVDWLRRATSRYIAVLGAATPAALDRVVRDLAGNALPAIVLERLLEQPDDVLKPVAGKLLELAEHGDRAIRAALTRGLGVATWVERDEIDRVLRVRLDDVDAAIRTDAQRALEGEPVPRGYNRIIRGE